MVVLVVVVGRGVDVGVSVETVVLFVGRGVEIVWLLADVPPMGVVVLVVFVLLLKGDGRRVVLPMTRGSVSCEVPFAAEAEVGFASDVSSVVPVTFLAPASVAVSVALDVV